MYRFASKGLMTPPCGVPQVLFFPPLTRGLPFPSRSSTGTFNHILIRCSMSRSTIRRATHCINSRCGIVSKYLDKSASTTSVLPAWSSSCTFWIASCALRFGDLGSIEENGFEGERSAFQQCRQRFTLHQLHHQVVRANVEECADIRVIQRRNGACLAFETRVELLVSGFDATARPSRGIDGAKNLAHAAFAQLTFH